MKDIEVTLNAIINYLGDHIKASSESWNFKGLDSNGFNVKALLELIYYVNPELFAGIKSAVEARDKNNERVD